MFACVTCSKDTPSKDVRGIMRHPYCKPCFKKDWKNDEDAYLRWLLTEHP